MFFMLPFVFGIGIIINRTSNVLGVQRGVTAQKKPTLEVFLNY